jgi:hypothetical protein
MLVSIMEENNIRGQLCEKILLLLANCALSNKQHFIANNTIIALSLTILNDGQFSIKMRAVAS